MRAELESIADWIERADLPADGESLFGSAWNNLEQRFNVQETYVLDYKDRVPLKFSDGYGSGIIRLALAMYNSYGGIIVFGVIDRELTVCGVDQALDVEAFNRVFSDVTGRSIECLRARPESC